MAEQLGRQKVFVLILALLVVAAIVFFLSDRLTLSFFLRNNYSKAKTPEMYITPIARKVQPPNEKFATQFILTYENIELKIPWKLREKSESEFSTFYVFKNKKGLSISQQGKDESFRQRLLDEEILDVQKSTFHYGGETLDSEYALANLILHTTPEQFSIFRPVAKSARIIPLLRLKGLYAVYGNTTYKFNLGNVRCFQFGNPQTNQNVYVHLFKEKDQVIRLRFVAATQPEIDHILSSIEINPN